MGVVLNRRQQYIWERGNQAASVRLDTAAIPEAMLAAPLDEATIQGIVGDGYTAMNLTGCSLSSILYQISSGYPVAVKTGEGSSALIVGYDQFNTWLYDTATQQVIPKGLGDSTNLFAESGNIFMSYREK